MMTNEESKDKRNNSGNWNSGHWNSGHWNSGDRNSGHWNSGDCNTGDYNSGDCNTGNWNSGDCNTGFFNTDEPTVRMFNKDTGLKRDEIIVPGWCCLNPAEWVPSGEMTEQEKQKHPSHSTVGGYLKTYGYKEVWRKAWDSVSIEERKKILDLPNFDADIFLEITGIDVQKELSDKVEITCEGTAKRNPRNGAGGC
jgi:hypothetical protein